MNDKQRRHFRKHGPNLFGCRGSTPHMGRRVALVTRYASWKCMQVQEAWQRTSFAKLYANTLTFAELKGRSTRSASISEPPREPVAGAPRPTAQWKRSQKFSIYWSGRAKCSAPAAS